jgi:hypothetical protein
VRLGQNGNAGNTTVGSEMVKVNMEKGSPGELDRAAHGRLHELEVIEFLGVKEIHDEVGSSEDHAIAMDEVV